MTKDDEPAYCSFCREPAVYQHKDMGYVAAAGTRPEPLRMCRQCLEKSTDYDEKDFERL